MKTKDREHFDQTARDVWHKLKSGVLNEFRTQVERIEFILMDEPDAEILKDLPDDLAENPEDICGLHSGVPITQESIEAPSLLPTRVYLFRKALLMAVEEEGLDLREEIAVTLLHEIGHHFGLDEDDLDRLGFG